MNIIIIIFELALWILSNIKRSQKSNVKRHDGLPDPQSQVYEIFGEEIP